MFIEGRATGNLDKHDTCFTFPHGRRAALRVGVDWAYYAALPGQPGYFWNAYNGFANVFHDKDYWNAHMRPVDRLVQDIEAGTAGRHVGDAPFPALRPSAVSSAFAHNWVTDIVNAVMRSDAWEHTASSSPGTSGAGSTTT